MSLKVVSISDTHDQHDSIILPEGDVLVHAGDITGRGNIQSLYKFSTWIAKQNFAHKIVIAGNHDFCFQNGAKNDALKSLQDAGVSYLEDSSTEVNGVKFWGSPWQPTFFDWAFNLPRGKALQEKWDLIPEDTNVLITHGPPYGIADDVDSLSKYNDDLHAGCKNLLGKVLDLPNLKAHIFGHIHGGYGTYGIGNKKFINASTCTEQYKPNNKPIVIEL